MASSSLSPPLAVDDATEPRGTPASDRRGPAQNWELVVVAVAAVATAIIAAVEPGVATGLPAADALYSALLAAGVTVAASIAARWTWLVLATPPLFLAVSSADLALAVPGVVVVLAGIALDRHLRVFGAMGAALAVQGLLHLPDRGPAMTTALVAVVAVAPVLISAVVRTGPVIRRWIIAAAAGAAALAVVFTGLLGAAAFASQQVINDGIDDARAAFASLKQGDVDTAVERFERASVSFATAQEKLGAWWVAPSRLVPVVGVNSRALEVSAEMGADLASTAVETGAAFDFDRLSIEGGTVDLAAFAELDEPTRVAVAALAHLSDGLAEVASPMLLPPLGPALADFRAEIDQALPTADLAVEALEVVPPLLGSEGPRTYFLIFGSPAESRELGGFMGNFAEILVDDGHIELVTTGRASNDLNDRPGEKTLTNPEDYPTRYLAYQQGTFFQNLTGTPDFPTVAAAAADLYPQAQGSQVDGVIYMDPFSLAAVLEITGPVTVPGYEVELDSTNAADFLLNTQYVLFPETGERSDFLEALIEATFDAFTQTDISEPSVVLDALGPVVAEDRLLVYSFGDESEEAFLSRVGLAGEFPAFDGGEFIAVNTVNSGPNKLDYYLQRDVDYNTTYDPGTGAVTAEVTVTLRNGIDPAEVASLPEVVVANYHGLPEGTNEQLVSIYTPLALQSLTIDGESVSAEHQVEYGLNRYLSRVELAPGSEQVLVFVIQGWIEPSETYALTVGTQPLVRPDEFSLTVTLPSDWEFEPGQSNEVEGVTFEGNIAVVAGPVASDTTLSLGVHRR